MKIDRDILIENHSLFDRTFLVESAITVSYPSIATKDKGLSLNRFLKQSYSIEADYKESDTLGKMTLNSKRYPLVFTYTDCEATVSASRQSYVNFENSLLPFARPLTEFAEIVLEADEFSGMMVHKRNLWIVETDTPGKAVEDGLNMIFRPGRRKNMPLIVADDRQAMDGISFETYPEVPNTDFVSHLKVSIKGVQEGKLNFYLDTFVSDNKPVHAVEEDFSLRANQLNDLAYALYVDLVSDKILELMLSK